MTSLYLSTAQTFAQAMHNPNYLRSPCICLNIYPHHLLHMFPTLTSCLRPPTFFLTINLTTVRNGMINLVRSHITENTFLRLPPQGAQPTHTHTNSFRSSHHCNNFSCTSNIRILILLRIKLDRKAKPGGYTGRKFYFPNDTPPN